MAQYFQRGEERVFLSFSGCAASRIHYQKYSADARAHERMHVTIIYANFNTRSFTAILECHIINGKKIIILS